MNKRQLEKLKEKWNKKLAASGFEDIENKDGSLKDSIHSRTLSYALQAKESREAYYATARQLLNDDLFSTQNDRAIWEAHCEGLSFRTIAKTAKITFYEVRRTVNKYKKVAGLA